MSSTGAQGIGPRPHDSEPFGDADIDATVQPVLHPVPDAAPLFSLGSFHARARFVVVVVSDDVSLAC